MTPARKGAPAQRIGYLNVLGGLAWAALIAVVGMWIYTRPASEEERVVSFFAYRLTDGADGVAADGAGGRSEEPIRFHVPEQRPSMQVLSWVSRLPRWVFWEPRSFVRYAIDLAFEDASGQALQEQRVWVWSRAAVGIDPGRQLRSDLWANEGEPLTDGRAIHLDLPEGADTVRLKAVREPGVDAWGGPIYVAVLEEVPRSPMQRQAVLNGQAEGLTQRIASGIGPFPWEELSPGWRDRIASLHWKRLTPLGSPPIVTVHSRGDSLPYGRTPVTGSVLVQGAALAWNVRGPLTVDLRWVRMDGDAGAMKGTGGTAEPSAKIPFTAALDSSAPSPVEILILSEDGTSRRADTLGDHALVTVGPGVHTVSLALSRQAESPILALAFEDLEQLSGAGEPPYDPGAGDISMSDIVMDDMGMGAPSGAPGPWGRGGRAIESQLAQASDVRSFDVWRAGKEMPLRYSASYSATPQGDISPTPRMIFHLRASLPMERLPGLARPAPSGITATIRALDAEGRELASTAVGLPGASPYERALRDDTELAADPTGSTAGPTPVAFAVGEVLYVPMQVSGAAVYEVTATGPVDVVGNVEINDSLQPFKDPEYALPTLPEGIDPATGDPWVIARYAPFYREPTRVVSPLDAGQLAAAGRLSRIDAQIRLALRSEWIDPDAGVRTTGPLPFPDSHELIVLPGSPGATTAPDRVPLHTYQSGRSGAPATVFVPGSGRLSIEYQIPSASAGATVTVWIDGVARALTLPGSAGSFALADLAPGARSIRVEGSGRYYAVAEGSPGWHARRVWYRSASTIYRIGIPPGEHAISLTVHRWGGCAGWIAWESGPRAGIRPLVAAGRAEPLSRSGGGLDVCAPVFLSGLTGFVEFSLEGLGDASAGAWISARSDWSAPGAPEPIHQRIREDR